MTTLFALGQSITDAMSTPVATLAQGLLHTITAARLKTTLAVMLALSVLAGGANWTVHRVLAEKPAETNRKAEAKPEADRTDAAKSETRKQARKDYYGDPLPAGALVRMGSVQLRHEGVYIAFSADSKTLVSVGRDAKIRFWDMAAGRETQQKRIQAGTSVAGLSPDGKILAAFGHKSLYLYDTTTGEELHHLSADSKGYPKLAFTADGKLMAALIGIANNYTIRLWDLSTGKQRFTVERLSQADNLVLSPDGKLLGSWEGEVGQQVLRLWDAATGRELGKERMEGRCWAISPDGKMIATADDNGTVVLWDTANLKKRGTLTPSRPITGRFSYNPHLAFSPDGALLAVGGLEALVLWDVAARKERRRLDDREARALVFAPDGKTLACVGRFEIRLWDTATGKRLHNRPGHDNYVQSVAVSPDGKTVASIAATDPVVRLWDAATGKPRAWSPRRNSWVHSCIFASDDRLLVAGGHGVLRLLDVDSGKELHRFVVKDLKSGQENHELLVMHFSADGKRLSAISKRIGQDDCQMTVWDAHTKERLVCRPFRGHMDSSFSTDGECVTVDHPERLLLEDTRAGRERGSIPGDLGRPVAFSPDGGLLAVGIHKTIDDTPLGGPRGYQPLGERVVEIASGEEIFHVDGRVEFAVFSPDGCERVTADQKELRLWDVATGENLLCRTWPEGFVRHPTLTPMYSLAFMPNGRALVTGLNDGTILVWNLTPESRARPIAHHLGREKLDALWLDLAGDARKAHRALHTLAAAPTDALPLLAERLRPAADVDARRVEKLLGDLDSEQFTVREAATKELARMGDRIEPALQHILKSKPSAEVRNRVQAILNGLRGVPSAVTLRTLRAIRLLERVGTSEARRILGKLAGGAAGARETREARAALERLAPPIAGRP